MTLTQLIGLCALAACVAAQGNFADYDYQDSFAPQQRAPERPAPHRFPNGPIRPKAAPTTTRAPPVAILKQINRHNDDGSYTYGYEAADGSFKIETKLVTGEVMGKYGYVDETGKLRTVEYGANKYGFQPSGEGITVPPPTLVDESTRKGPNGEPLEYDDESYYAPEPIRPTPRPNVARPRPRPQPQPQSQPQYQPQPQPQRQQFEDAYIAPSVRQQPSSGPVPPRASIPGAAPSFAPQQAPQFRAAPSPRPAPRPAPVREQPRPSRQGILDNLAQQYALPRGQGQPLHDISFSSYSTQTNF